MGLNISQHLGVRNFLRLHFALLFFLKVFLNVKQRLQVPQRIVNLRLRHLRTDAGLAADDVAVVSDQQLPCNVLANVVTALIVAYNN